jgi:hypothetical protein
MSLTRSLGQFVADLSPRRLPAEAVRVARLGYIDCIGTMIAGRQRSRPLAHSTAGGMHRALDPGVRFGVRAGEAVPLRGAPAAGA